MPHINLNNTKSDRALALHEKGLDSEQIAARIGCSPHNVPAFIQNALKKRERLRQKASQ